MIREPFATGRSWMHAVDPRLRVTGATVYALIVAVSHDYVALAVALILSLTMAMTARLDMREVFHRLTAPFLFLLLLWAVLPWSYEGTPFFKIGPVVFSKAGLHFCLQISVKTMSLLIAFMALLATMTIDTLGHTLSRLRLPDKLVYLLLITYRYVFVLEQEYRRLTRAMKIRSFHPKTNLHSYRTYAYLVGMLFVRASVRAQRVYSAMICRGFSGRFISLRVYPHHPRNVCFTVALSFLLILLIALEWV